MTRWDLRTVIWGALFLWIGVMMVVDERAGVASIGSGAILLLGAVARRASPSRAGLTLTIAGLLLVGFGLNDLNGTDKGIPLIAVMLIAFGALAIGKALGRNRVVPRDPTITIRFPGSRI
jgi:hypothetical protein